MEVTDVQLSPGIEELVDRHAGIWALNRHGAGVRLGVDELSQAMTRQRMRQGAYLVFRKSVMFCG
jgi:hypothetical protein